MGVAGGGSSRRAPEQLLSGFILWSWAKEEKDNAEAQRALRRAEEWWNSWVRAEDLGIAVDGTENSAPSQSEGCGTQEAIGLKSCGHGAHASKLGARLCCVRTCA